MGYSDRLRQLCGTKGLEQAALAARVGLSKSTVSRILTGSQEPKLGQAYALAQALGVSLDYLTDETSDATELGTRTMTLTDDEVALIRVARVLGVDVALRRLVVAESPPPESR